MNNRLFLFLILLCLFVCCLGVVSAADISVSDIHDIGDEYSVVNDSINSVNIDDSIVSHKSSQFNDTINLDNNYNSSKYIDHVVDGPVNSTEGVYNSSKYGGSIVNGSNVTNSSFDKDNFVHCVVSCEGDFKNVSNQFKNLTNSSGVIVNITSNIDVSCEGTVLDFNCKNKTMVIFGNGFNVGFKNPSIRGENHFLKCGDDSSILMCDVRVSGFNTAIANQGKCIFENVTFDGNKLNYKVQGYDRGGAIWNCNHLECYNCTFVNNLAMFGGAVYSNGTLTTSKFVNCRFEKNKAYRESGDSGICAFFIGFGKIIGDPKSIYTEKGGNDIFMGNDATVSVYTLSDDCTPFSKIDFGKDETKPRLIYRNSTEPITREYVVNDVNSLKSLSKEMYSTTDVDTYVIKFTNDISFKAWSKDMSVFEPRYGHLIVNGNGHIIKFSGDIDGNNHFAVLNRTSMNLNNLTISGFNCGIMDYGVAILNNVCFKNNNVKYTIYSGDEAGAIYNLGFLTCNNCSFIKNSGNYAGSIYNALGGEVTLNNCTFINDTHYKSDGAELYNYGDANYVIDGVYVNKTTSFNNTSIAYGKLPGTLAKLGYCGIKLLAALSTTACAAIGGSVSAGTGTAIGYCVGAGVGTVLGSAISFSDEIWYSSLTHSVTSKIFLHLPRIIIEHFLMAIMSAEIGMQNTLTKLAREQLNGFLRIYGKHT